jgi:hypothetical protein
METNRRDFMRLGLMGAGCSLAGMEFSQAAEAGTDITLIRKLRRKSGRCFQRRSHQVHPIGWRVRPNPDKLSHNT